jgi:acetate kinase
MSGILVLNCGSSSVKYRMFRDGRTDAAGLIERIGEPGGDADSHERALDVVMSMVDADAVVAVGHRVVHGGLRFSEPTLVDDEVIAEVHRLIPLAPLHNPANLAGLEAARAALPNLPQVAVFDTAFHRTLPPAASTYALDTGLAERLGIHRYGFHGTSHAYVSRRTAELLGRRLSTINTITLHLGNGASACAVAGGRSVETSMGFTPLEGLVMGTRTGDLDPGVVLYLQRARGLGVDEIDRLVNRRSGLAGLCGENDMRAVLARRAAADPAATLAFDVYCGRIRHYVGAYYAALGRVDAITFTAGVGQHSPEVRAAALTGLQRLGIVVDPARNEATGPGERIISPDGAEVAVCVIPTDEELEIARQTQSVVAGMR